MPKNKHQTARTATEKRLFAILAAGSRAFGTRLCYHDLSGRFRIPMNWQTHRVPACMRARKQHPGVCMRYCGAGGQIEKLVGGRIEGIQDCCPFGFYQLVIPVLPVGALAGILFAGVFYVDATAVSQRSPEVPVIRERHWLDDRMLLLSIVGEHIARFLREDTTPESPRRMTINAFMEKNLTRPIGIDDLSTMLLLSPSRTRGVVRELYGCGFCELFRRMRLERAAHWLCGSDRSASDIAVELGFYDQAHFCRLFARHFGRTPLAYRRLSTPRCRP